MGNIHQVRREIDDAELYFLDYLNAAQKLMAIDAENPKHQLELSYATNNMATIKFRRQNYSEARAFFKDTIETKIKILNAAPNDNDRALSLAASLSWLALTDISLGRFEDARKSLNKEKEIYKLLLLPDPEDYSVLYDLAVAHRRTSTTYLNMGNSKAALAAAESSRSIVEKLLSREPESISYQINASRIAKDLSELAMLNGNLDDAIKNTNDAVHYATLDRVVDSSNANSSFALIQALATSLNLQPSETIAQHLAETISDVESRKMRNRTEAVSIGNKSLAAYFENNGNSDRARSLRSRQIAELEERQEKLKALDKLTLFELLIDQGEIEKARAIDQQFAALKLKHPRYVALRQKL